MRVGGFRVGRAREVAKEVEGFAEGVLGAAVEARRVHAEGCIAEGEKRQGMLKRVYVDTVIKKLSFGKIRGQTGLSCVVAAVAGRLA